MTATRFNSVVYATTTAYDYYAAMVTDNFFQGANWTTAAITQSQWNFPGQMNPVWLMWMSEVQEGKLFQIRYPTGQ